MSRNDIYFQFPIHALYLDKPLGKVIHEEKQSAIQRIIKHTVLHVGGSRMCPDFDYVTAATKYAAENDYDWFDVEDERHLAIVLGAATVHVTPGHPDSYSWDNLIREQKFGKRQTRIRRDILWDSHNSRAASWREFAVLSAVYAGIGNKPYAQLSYDQIRTMAMGYNGLAEYTVHHGRRKDRRLTLRQTRTTMGHLHDRGLFVRVCPNRRHVFYSNSLSAKGLHKAIVRRGAKIETRKASVGASDDAVRREIREQVEAATRAYATAN